MSLCRNFYETLVSKALCIVKFQKAEDVPLDAPSIGRLRAVSLQCGSPCLVERLRRSLIVTADIATADTAKAESANNQDASPVQPNSSLVNRYQPAVPLPASGSAKGNGLGIVCGVNSISAVAQEKEKDTAARRARVTSTRLTALKTYLEQGAN